jgi:hypothetical protein
MFILLRDAKTSSVASLPALLVFFNEVTVMGNIWADLGKVLEVVVPIVTKNATPQEQSLIADVLAAFFANDELKPKS